MRFAADAYRPKLVIRRKSAEEVPPPRPCPLCGGDIAAWEHTLTCVRCRNSGRWPRRQFRFDYSRNGQRADEAASILALLNQEIAQCKTSRR